MAQDSSDSSCQVFGAGACKSLAVKRLAGAEPVWYACMQSNTHVVLATLKRAQNDMSSYQRKMFKVDDHMGIAIAGLTADGRVLCKYMRNECINHR